MKKILFCLLGIVFLNVATAQTQRPNIIFFIVDDFGYYDTGCYGSTFYETPAIDQLATDGIRFTNAYEAAPRCVSSRKAIMAGQYPYRPGMDKLEGSHYTWAEALNDDGYASFFTGKWHLGEESDRVPEAQGFDTNIAGGSFGSPPTYWFPYAGLYNGTNTQLPHVSTTRFDGTNDTDTPRDGDDEEYLTDRLTLETNKWISDHVAANPTQPFVAMVSHYGVHTPIEGKSSYEAKYQAKNLINNHPADASVVELTGKSKLYQDNVTYASMIQSIDESMRDIRAKLAELEIDDNTVIILTSDNGGVSTVPIASGREMVTSNKPLKTGKGWLYEGGIKLPLIVYGPNFRHGVVESTPVVGTDFYPTMLDIAGTTLRPNDHKDGLSFLSALENENYVRSEPIIWNYDFAKVGTGNPAMGAVRQGKYKLVELKYNWQYELYDLDVDPNETNDISATNTAKVIELKSLLFNKRSEVGTSHTVTNSGFIATQQTLYQEMNEETGSNVQAAELCGAPENGSIVRNGDFECRYDIDWSLGTSNGAEAVLSDGSSEAKDTSDEASKIEVTTAGSLGHVRLENTVYEANLNDETITVSVYAKSPDAAKIRFQLKTESLSGDVKTYTGAIKHTLTNSYIKYQESFDLDAIDTKNITLRIQCGEVEGILYLDEVEATYPIPEPPAPGHDIITNKDFEEGYNTDWSLLTTGNAVAVYAAETNDVNSGSIATKVTVSTAEVSNGKVALNSTKYTALIEADKLKVSCFAKSVSGAPSFQFKIKYKANGESGFSTSSDFVLTSIYQKFEEEFTLPVGVTELEIQAICGKNVGVYLFDNFDTSLVSETLNKKELVLKTLDVYPNPATNYINLESTYKINTVVLYTVTGKTISVNANFNKRLNLQNLNSGVYLAKVIFNNGVKLTKKIMVR